MNCLKIVCLNERCFELVYAMYSSCNRLRKKLLSRFFTISSFEVNGLKGVSIVVKSPLVQIDHVKNDVNKSLVDEGLVFKTDYLLEVE